MPLAALPHPLKLAVRLGVASILVLWMAHSFQRTLIEPLLPALRATIEYLESDFTILGTDIAREGPNETIRVRANLASPLYVAGRIVYPMGWNRGTEGWLQVNLTLGGVLQYVSLMLIVVLAWPAQRVSEFIVRIAIALPLITLLLLLHAPFTILADLWFPIHDDYDPHSFWPLLAWSRFLMGGGGIAAALLLAIVAIVLARFVVSGRRAIERAASAVERLPAERPLATRLFAFRGKPGE